MKLEVWVLFGIQVLRTVVIEYDEIHNILCLFFQVRQIMKHEAIYFVCYENSTVFMPTRCCLIHTHYGTVLPMIDFFQGMEQFVTQSCPFNFFQRI